MEQDPKAIDYKKIKFKKSQKNLAIIVGTETTGIKKGVLNQCDQIAEISMRGKKESLNVSVAFGILLFRLLNI